MIGANSSGRRASWRFQVEIHAHRPEEDRRPAKVSTSMPRRCRSHVLHAVGQREGQFDGLVGPLPGCDNPEIEIELNFGMFWAV